MTAGVQPGEPEILTFMHKNEHKRKNLWPLAVCAAATGLCPLSLMHSAKLNGRNVYAYLKDVLNRHRRSHLEKMHGFEKALYPPRLEWTLVRRHIYWRGATQAPIRYESMGRSKSTSARA